MRTSSTAARVGTDAPSPTDVEIVAFLRSLLPKDRQPTDTINEQTDLLADLQLDSIEQLSLLIAIENHFEICFDPEDELSIRTVGNVVETVRRHLARDSSAGDPP